MLSQTGRTTFAREAGPGAPPLEVLRRAPAAGRETEARGEGLPDRALLVTHVPLRRIGGRLCLDDQTCAGLVRLCESFGHVTYMGIDAGQGAPDPALPEALGHWRPVADLPCADRLTVVALPDAYRVKAFAAQYRGTRAQLAEAIRTHRYLWFYFGALVGDWGAVAALEAMRQRRPYAVWSDRVEHEVVRLTSVDAPLRRRVKHAVTLPVMVRFHRYLVGRAHLGLFQGQDTFRYHAPHSRRPFCIYDTHTTRDDHIPAAAVEDKCRALLQGTPLRLVYVGRASPMKAPLDWLETLRHARRAGVPFTATWWGDGPLLDAMRARVAELGLSDRVTLAGFEADRERLLGAMRAAHLFLFCHRTPESPRCLIEALVCGTPILGYGSPYSDDLVTRDGGGRLGPMGNPAALAGHLATLDRDRAGLAEMVRAAARTGTRFDEETVYRHRAELLRQYL